MDKVLDKGLIEALEEAMEEVTDFDCRGNPVLLKDLYENDQIAMQDFTAGFKSGYYAAKRESKGKEFIKKLNKLRKTLGQREIDV